MRAPVGRFKARSDELWDVDDVWCRVEYWLGRVFAGKSKPFNKPYIRDQRHLYSLDSRRSIVWLRKKGCTASHSEALRVPSLP